jgi:hypothetical protein
MGFALSSLAEGPARLSLRDLLPASVSKYSAESRLQTLRLGQCSAECLTAPDDSTTALWFEPRSGGPAESGASPGSFVYVSGWCYRIGATSDSLTQKDYEEILARHRKGLPPVPDDTSGSYVVVAYDHYSGQLVLQPDRWTMRSLYYAEGNGGFAVSTSSTFVADATSAALDGQSVLSLMRGTHMPFGRTMFAGVHRVMCGGYIQVDTKTPEIRLLSSGSFYVPTQEQRFKENLDHLVGVMGNVGARLSRCRSMIDLTGGNDSRLTAAAIQGQTRTGLGDHILWRVAGTDQDPDVQIARRIADLFGWNLRRLDTPEVCDASVEDLENVALLSDGTCLIDSSFSRVRQESAFSQGWDLLVGSVGGELIRGFFWRQEILSLGRSSQVNLRAILMYRLYASSGVRPTVLGPGAPRLDEHDEILLDGYRRAADLGGATLNPYKLDAMYLHKLCYHAGNPHSWLSALKEIRLPLLSWEVMRFVLAVPWRHRAHRRLILSAIERMSPQLSKIPNDKGESMSPHLIASLPKRLKSTLLLVKRGVPRVARGFLGKRTAAVKRVPPPPHSWVALLRQNKHVGPAVDPSVVQSVCDEASGAAATRDSLNTFYALLTMELLLRRLKHARSAFRF